jgi:peptidoglycan/xylan/chitin deacetylase (PgdA/CDA1 family)
MINLRKSIYVSLYFINNLFDITPPPIVVFCYHNVSRQNWRFNVPLSTFKKQVSYLKSIFRFITLSDLWNFLQNKKVIAAPSAILTFDDGYAGIIQTVKFLRQEGIRPAVFVLADKQKANRRELENNNQLLTDKEIEILQKNNWTIGCHSQTHADFSCLTRVETEREIIGAKQKLESKLKTSVDFFAFPKGRYNQEVLTIAVKAGYLACFTMDDGIISQKTNPFLIPRIGVDRSHSFTEFAAAFTKSAIYLRKIIKNSGINYEKYIN